jgi:CubicO group peptidase (beta-lactamase class C family)
MSAGVSDIARGIPVTDETKYMAASVTKQFTASAVMKLVATRSVSANDAIDGYFPELPRWSRSVTIRNLMNHSSGIPDYFDDSFIERYCVMGKPCRDDEPMRIISDYRELLFEPGTECSYSNSGYYLLGELLRRITGVKFSEFAAREILGVAGMNDSVFLDTGERPGHMAIGYTTKREGLFELPFNRSVAGWADGNLCCTPMDLYRWHVALTNRKIMDGTAYETMISPLVLPDGRKTGAGYGWFSGFRAGIREIWHTGSVPGYCCRISRFTDPRCGNAVVILMCNADVGMADDMSSVFGRIAHALLGDEMSLPIRMDGSARVSAGHYETAAYDGTYCDVSVTKDGLRLAGNLRGFRGGLEFYRVKQVAGERERFASDETDAVIEFEENLLIVDDIGRMTYMKLREE